MGLREKVERVLKIQEGEIEPGDEFERKCFEFFNYLKDQIKEPYFFWDDWLRENFERIERLSFSKEPVLLLGESGSGKEIISRLIHFLSGRREKPYYPLNCSSQPEELLFSELFGHERGAYTDAKGRREGKLRASSGGTVFLDEIQGSSEEFQHALLRFLDYGEIQPPGTERIERVDVRIMEASSLSLEELKEELYEPFFYRISGLELILPSVGERKDKEGYIYYFLMKECKSVGKKGIGISSEAVEALIRYTWGGNLREMRRTIHELVLMSDGVIKEEDVSQSMERREGLSAGDLKEGRGLDEMVLEYEREVIYKALQRE